MTDLEKFELEKYGEIIARVEGNCFSVKTLAVTIIAASIAFVTSIEDNQRIVIGSAIFLSLIFWNLDSRYLREGRRFRVKQIDLLRKISEQNLTLSATTPSDNLFATMMSWSIAWFYGALIFLLLAILYVL